MRVICVRWGEKYGPEYVERLERAVNRHFRVPHEFVVVRDNPPSDLPGCWQKVGLFKPGAFPGLNLYLDLDVIIHSEITFLADLYLNGKVAILDDFRHGFRHPFPKPLTTELRTRLGAVNVFNSSVMVWNGDDPGPQRIWTEFDPKIMATLAGDQNWITRVLAEDGASLLPERLAGSYRYHYLKGVRRPITVFHGHPKPGDLTDAELLRDWQ